MNRVIKFRAWDKDGCVMKSTRTMSEIMISTPMHYEVVDDYIFEQFTGLTDKNGVEIYDGDILRPDDDCDDNYSACWSNDAAQWMCSDGECLVEYHESDEVIGNIHENPELLTDGE